MSLVPSVVLYISFAALFGPAAGVVAILVFGAVGFIAWLTTIILAAQ